MEAYFRVTDLPWSLGTEQDEKFRRLLRKMAPAVIAFALVMPFLPVNKVVVTSEAELPPQLAKFIMERRIVPPSVKPVVKPVAKPEPPKTKPRPVEKTAVEKPVEPAPDRRQAARARAANIGVAAFADELRDLRENVSVDRVASSTGLSAGANAAQVERSMINAKSGRASGGINTAALSRDTGGSGLAGRSTTRVAGGSVGGGHGSASGGDGGNDNSRLASRSREEIELIFDKNKAAIFALYNRALRRNPALEGKLVLKLTIAPSGEVTHCEVVSSELAEADFERKLVQRVKMFNFGAKKVATMTTTKPIDFFPA